MRILGLDFGSKTVGVAITDPLGLTAQGLEVIRRDRPNKLRKTIARIEEIIGEYEVGKIVMGMPLNMDGTEGERAELTKEFAEKLKKRCELDIEFQDERLTTVEAYEIMEQTGTKNKEDIVDEVAAVVILEDYMAANK
ncbi:MAG: Holliday junction resolvase RuvX [Eubacterium sp.]|nr:Holliday junction resolvase RuvX [Eubacterium sp.]